ncbi:succinylglutamate desuccinylase/aspartoacylase family protein [Haloarcula litorea]|uniref:succinylglutamate desuccinylase/aspartoacylase family protein n=1 Tax=Haloarcula litorea TaxID=3032579 RepID=UPI0023E8CEFC|nr:succinylglutamate desuccinylase/aspartoacylase family protein [Halomicroarcula sp. GDY20]
MRVGTATTDPGETATGWLDVTTLPTGGRERLPVLLAEGTGDGPTLWVTAGVHGDELTGVAAAQDLLDDRLPDRLAGDLVVVPTVNPAGLRRTSRESYYHGDDPNRYFPDPDADQYRPPRVQQRIDEALFDAVTGDEDAPVTDAAADALLDLHTAHVGSLPFVIRDRTLYGDRRDEAAAEALRDDLAALADALGLPVVTEYTDPEYTGEGLHRSLTGAVTNEAGVPALTVELGTHSVVDETERARGVAAVYRALVNLGALDTLPGWVPDTEPITSGVDYRLRRAVHPHTDTAGLVRHRVAVGDVLTEGDPVADVVSPHGEVRATVATDHDGVVLGRGEGMAVYENDPLASLAVRDEAPLVVPREES